MKNVQVFLLQTFVAYGRVHAVSALALQDGHKIQPTYVVDLYAFYYASIIVMAVVVQLRSKDVSTRCWQTVRSLQFIVSSSSLILLYCKAIGRYVDKDKNAWHLTRN